MADQPAVLVLGTVTTTTDDLPELLEAALAHVHRSRLESGCISHHVTQDPEDHQTLHFVERWRDRAALDEHFRQPGSATFVEVAQRLATAPPTIDVYDVATMTAS
jgi:quinol monooxygenase YgiN